MPRGLYIYQYTRMAPFVKGTAHFIRPAAAFFSPRRRYFVDRCSFLLRGREFLFLEGKFSKPIDNAPSLYYNSDI